MNSANRYYLSSAGYLVDRKNDTIIARLREQTDWQISGQHIVAALNRGDDSVGVFALWDSKLEPNHSEV